MHGFQYARKWIRAVRKMVCAIQNPLLKRVRKPFSHASDCDFFANNKKNHHFDAILDAFC
jgi:hypothetical protein